jgi:hypothetical protein
VITLLNKKKFGILEQSKEQHRNCETATEFYNNIKGFLNKIIFTSFITSE